MQQIRLSNGRCIKEKFPADSTLAAVLAFVQRQQCDVVSFQLIQVALFIYLFYYKIVHVVHIKRNT